MQEVQGAGAQHALLAGTLAATAWHIRPWLLTAKSSAAWSKQAKLCDPAGVVPPTPQGVQPLHCQVLGLNRAKISSQQHSSLHGHRNAQHATKLNVGQSQSKSTMPLCGNRQSTSHVTRPGRSPVVPAQANLAGFCTSTVCIIAGVLQTTHRVNAGTNQGTVVSEQTLRLSDMCWV